MVNLATRSPRRSAVPARRAIRKATTQRDEGPGLTAWHDLGADGARKHRTRLAVVVYRRDMPGRKRPTPEDAMAARHALLDGLARDADIFEVLSQLAPLHPRNNTFPGEVFLHLAADALDWCEPSSSAPASGRTA